MLSQSQRATILELHAQGVGRREIARLLGVSRQSIRRVLKANSTEIPKIERAEKAAPFRQQILELLPQCKGNLVRVHEELAAAGAEFSYQALTAFCRREGIGQTPVVPAGRYEFAPGEETQHDTSPHDVAVGGRKFRAQTAAVTLCYSRMLFFQILPAFQRFDCKVFLTDAARYLDGVTARMMIDNTHVVVLRGSGRAMEPVPEMAAFATRLGFHFVAHEIGDANRSARVERPFHFIENNFLAGRTFADWQDLNRQARQWCDRVNATYKKHIRAVPRELYAVERPRLKPLPAWLPEVYRLHHRIVDVEGYVYLDTNRYSVPERLIGKEVEVYKYPQQVKVLFRHREVAEHPRLVGQRHAQSTLKEHRRANRRQAYQGPSDEERQLRGQSELLDRYISGLKQRSPGRGVSRLRRLLAMRRSYPPQAFIAAVETALQYGLYDLHRLEHLILERVAGDFFHIDPDDEESEF